MILSCGQARNDISCFTPEVISENEDLHAIMAFLARVTSFEIFQLPILFFVLFLFFAKHEADEQTNVSNRPTYGPLRGPLDSKDDADINEM